MYALKIGRGEDAGEKENCDAGEADATQKKADDQRRYCIVSDFPARTSLFRV